MSVLSPLVPRGELAASSTLFLLLRSRLDGFDSFRCGQRFCPMLLRGTCLVLILLIAVALRLAALFLLPDALTDDPDSYARFAHQLAENGVYGPNPGQPSAYRPPGYPLLLLPWCRTVQPDTWGIAGLHLVAGIVTVLCTWRMSQYVQLGGLAWLPALLVAVDPLLVRQTTLLMTETVFVALLTGLMTCWLSQPVERLPSENDRAKHARLRGHVLVGLVLAAAALTRPSVWAFWALLGLAAWANRSLRAWVCGSAVALTLCAPWVVRNAVVLGQPILTTTHGGYTLWLGQNPVYYAQVVAGPHTVWPRESFGRWSQANGIETTGMSELERDRYFRCRALAWMRSEPLAALHSVCHHVWMFWTPAPRQGPLGLRLLCGIFYSLIHLLALLGVLQVASWRMPMLAIALAPIAWTAVHAVYWSNVRMRAPLVPLLAVLAAVGCARLCHWRNSRRSRTESHRPE